MVDLTWVSPRAALGFRSWRVLAEVESLSDHVFIEYELSISEVSRQEERDRTPARWTLRKMDGDKLIAALMGVSSWADAAKDGGTIEDDVNQIREMLVEACDVGMPRSRPRPRKAQYW